MSTSLPTLPTTAPYCTHIPHRSPMVKSHMTLALAKAAVTSAATHRGTSVDIQVYQWSDQYGWQIMWDIPAGTTTSQLPWKGGK